MLEAFAPHQPVLGSSASPLPRVAYSLHCLRNNCTVLRNICARYGVEIAGVTKATGGNPNIAEAMLDAGIPALADSRLTNIRRLRDAGITAPIMLVRAPTFAEIPDAAQLADVFLLSGINTIRTFPIACKAIGKAAKIIVMVDMGDLREGIPPANLPNLLDQIEATENASIIGIGTNLACNIGILPDEENMQHLAQLSRETEAKIGRRLRYISAGNSSAIALLVEGRMPSEINHLRLGESLFLGRETAFGQRI